MISLVYIVAVLALVMVLLTLLAVVWIVWKLHKFHGMSFYFTDRIEDANESIVDVYSRVIEQKALIEEQKQLVLTLSNAVMQQTRQLEVNHKILMAELEASRIAESDPIIPMTDEQLGVIQAVALRRSGAVLKGQMADPVDTFKPDSSATGSVNKSWSPPEQP